MLNYYQPYLLPFLGLKSYHLPKNIKRYYYLSMEDAIWEFTRKMNIPKGSLFLFPDFYCVDVLNNVKMHGFQYKLWKVDRHFNTNIDAFIKLIIKEKPRMVFVFHAAGITSNLFKDTRWVPYLPPDSFIIEDCVHRLVNPAEIKLINKRHIIMDSLRKDSPLPGSFVYGAKETLTYTPSPYRFSWYLVSTSIWYILFRWILKLGSLLNNAHMTNFAHEKILQIHDDIIGDSWESYRGLPWVPLIHRFIDFRKIEQLKVHQVKMYKKLMQRIYSSSQFFYEIEINEKDYKNFHVYPVGILVPESETKNLILYLHKNNISVWIKFPKCDWNKKKSCLFLPLGFHVSDAEIEYAVNKIIDFKNS